MAAGVVTNGSLQKWRERFQETLVLGLRADGHPQRSLAPERPAGAHQDPALGEPAHDVALDALLAQVEPDEVGLGLRGLDPQRSQPVLETDPLGDNHRVMMPTYSIAKISAEAVVRTMARQFDVPTVIARLNTPYGETGGWPYYHLLMMKNGVALRERANGICRPPCR